MLLNSTSMLLMSHLPAFFSVLRMVIPRTPLGVTGALAKVADQMKEISLQLKGPTFSILTGIRSGYHRLVFDAKDKVTWNTNSCRLIAHKGSLDWEDGGAEGLVGNVVDGLGLVVERVGEVVRVLGLPQGEHLLVVIDDDVDIGLAQALLLGGAGLDAVADDDGGGGGGRAGKRGDGEGLEETHLD